MNQTNQSAIQRLYPLCFEPICQYRLWGGQRLGNLNKAFAGEGIVGEVWC
jgi:hypothetical protein